MSVLVHLNQCILFMLNSVVFLFALHRVARHLLRSLVFTVHCGDTALRSYPDVFVNEFLARKVHVHLVSVHIRPVEAAMELLSRSLSDDFL